MKYIFHYVSINKCPNVKDWKLVIFPENNISFGIIKPDSILDESLDKSLQAYSYHYFSNSHINLDDQLKRYESSNEYPTGLFYSVISHPMLLDSMKRQNIEKHLQNGEIIYINRSGGYCIAKGFTILEIIESDKLIFPKEIKSKEKITISKYPAGDHWYLSSNMIGRIFEENGFNKQDDAIEKALQYVSKKEITIKHENMFAYKRSGD